MFKRFRDLLFSSDIPLQERMFLLAGLLGFFAYLSVFIVNLTTNQGLGLTIGLGIGAVLVPVIVVLSYRAHRITLGGIIISIMSICIALPVGYVLGGGVYSGAPIWFILGFLFVAIVLRGKILVLFNIITAASLIAITVYGYMYPDRIISLPTDYAVYEDSIVSVVVVGILAGLILRFQSMVYEKENDLVTRQGEEIEALSDSQNRFFSSMSHEIRTPINTIIGLNEMILRDSEISEEIAENAVNIQNASKMLLALINDILDMSKIESGMMEVAPAQYETSRMFSDIVNLLWARARDKGLRFDINVGENVPSMLYGDEMRLKQVIVNILTNAIKYTEEGSVVLTVDGETTDQNTFLLKIDVEDTGSGIKRENLLYIFDSFKRVDESDNKAIEGTGLGLAISKQLITLMGGRITVDSIYTKGSTFHIELEQNIVDSAPMQFQVIKDVGTGKVEYKQAFEAPEAHVLIVDDNDMNRMVSRKLLRGTKVQVDLAASGSECLERTENVHYDAIFMDHEMPDMDGIETLRRLRTQTNGLCRNTPVIALTANAGSDMNQFYTNNGFQAYIAKPIHGSLLEATLLQFLPTELIEKTVERQEGETFHVTQAARKKPVQITTDCVCDLTDDIIKECELMVMPFYVNTNGGRFRDLSEIDSDNIFEFLQSKDAVVKSEPGSVDEYETFFAEALSEADAVVHLALSAGAGKGCANAMAAAESFENVTVIDTRNISVGIGILAMHAGRMAQERKPIEEIVQYVNDNIGNIRTTILMTDVKRIGGNYRVPLSIRMICNIFNMDLALQVKKGKLKFYRFFGSYVTTAANKYIRSILRRAEDADDSVLYVMTSGCSVEEQREMAAEIDRNKKFDRVIFQKASATIASNAGLHSFGLVYMKKPRGKR